MAKTPLKVTQEQVLQMQSILTNEKCIYGTLLVLLDVSPSPSFPILLTILQDLFCHSQIDLTFSHI